MCFQDQDFPGGSDSKASAYTAGDPGSIPGSGRSPGEGNGNPLQYSCLENPMDGGAWLATVHGVAKSRTRLSDFTIYLFRIRAGSEGSGLSNGCQVPKKHCGFPGMVSAVKGLEGRGCGQ